MSYEVYRILHIAGLSMLALGLGGILLAPGGAEGKASRLGVFLHGLGLLVMLVAGFGMMAKLAIAWPWPGWLWSSAASCPARSAGSWWSRWLPSPPGSPAPSRSSERPSRKTTVVSDRRGVSPR
jgi:hypothetical protein